MPYPISPEHAMRTSETLLLDFIRQSPQLRIPVNQRRFGWTQRECRQLWEDYSATIWMGAALPRLNCSL